MKPYVDILGTRYRIEIRKADEDKYLRERHADGYCSKGERLIVIADLKTMPDSEFLTETENINIQKDILRHEVVHAFLNESGLSTCANAWGGAWPKNEEMVDWIALQAPKIFETYKYLECM